MRILILVALLGAALAAPKHSSRIVGGTVTTIEEYPYMVNMQYLMLNIYWLQFCGGSLITPNSILSAAQCYAGFIPAQWRAVLGTSYRSFGGTIHNLAQITIHHSYNISPMDGDIAIVHLANSAVLSPTIQTVAIASATTQLNAGLPVTIMGWGQSWFEGFPSEQLQHAEVFIVDQEICAQRYAQLVGINIITPGMACAGILDVGGKDGCQGDSGGPVVFTGSPHLVVGVSSWGNECAHPDYPGVIARVSAYTNWIVAIAS